MHSYTGVAGLGDGSDDLRQQVDLFLRIFDSTENGIIITDPDGYILYLNSSYGQFLDLDPEVQVGRHCTEVIDNSRMHVVGQTGISELNQIQNLRGVNIMVERIPVKRYGRVIAVFGRVLFSDLNKVTHLARTVEALDGAANRHESHSGHTARYTFDSIIGESDPMVRVRSQARRASANAFPVLISGESGTGKEFFAHAIHNHSVRKNYPFVKINCAAIPENLLESELFGYDPGAYTGAGNRGKPGKFELAHQGTIFLDEIGDMPVSMQAKLLRVLEEKTVERVGGTRVIKCDFRVIAATNQDLGRRMNQGRFRNDLFYRLNVISLNLPPLRDRNGDISLLAKYLLREIARQAGHPVPTLLPGAMALLENHTWPGNVRELVNALEQAFSQFDGKKIREWDLPDTVTAAVVRPSGGHGKLQDLQTRTERDAILAALESCDYNKSKAAQLLGIHRTSLYKKIRKYALPLNANL